MLATFLETQQHIRSLKNKERAVWYEWQEDDDEEEEDREKN